jgi:pimeloyl-ACP methyl ester carboxylesterase
VPKKKDDMPTVTTTDGVKLFYIETGSGFPVIFIHEFAGDYRSYEWQLHHFSRQYRCIACNARGYPPSDVPNDLTAYSQERARDDIRDLLDALKIEQAHIVGVSMGGFAALHFGLMYPERARSLVLGGTGYGANPSSRAQFQNDAEQAAIMFETIDMRAAARSHADGPGRQQLRSKDPLAFAEFVANLSEHSPIGSAMTLRGVQKRRPSLYDLADQMKKMVVPVMVIAGDEDEPCVEPALFMKRTIPSAGLTIFPRTGHALNVEEASSFNRIVDDFFHQVEADRWPLRQPAPRGRIL